MPQPRRHDHPAARQRAYRERLRQAAAQQLAVKGLPSLPAIPTLPGYRRWTAGLLQAKQLLETVAQEMRDYYDQRSEQWQESDRAETLQEQLDQITDLAETLGEILAEEPVAHTARAQGKEVTHTPN